MCSRRKPIPQLILLILLLGALFYLLGWVKKGDMGWFTLWLRQNGWVIVAAVAAFAATRNMGLAVFAGMITYSVSRARIFQPRRGTTGAQGADPRDGDFGRSGNGGPARGMTLEEAYLVLELRPGATRDEVLASHRNLIKRCHPDQGGSTYIAAKVNEAKDVLLRAIP